MTSEGGAPAGWYSDPAGGGGVRYWDGGSWTEHVSAPTVPGPSSPMSAPAPQNSGAIIGVTITLDVLLAMCAGIVSLMGQFATRYAADVCGDRRCDLVPVGSALFTYGPFVCVLLAVIVSAVLMVRRRPAWWVPLIGFVVLFAVWIAGATLVAPGKPY